MKWALCFRTNMLTRGNNTNNYCESQFGIIKDGILNRTKQYNVNGRIEKLLEDFNHHYENKLLSVANGSFDGVYSKRFMGRGKSNTEGVGFKMPSPEEVILFLSKLVSLGDSVFTAPSISRPNEYYIINMGDGFCSCMAGRNGAPCKHQYLVWANKRYQSQNFLPYFSKEERQKFAQIACGTSLPLEYYEGIHEATPSYVIDNHTPLIPDTTNDLLDERPPVGQLNSCVLKHMQKNNTIYNLLAAFVK